MSRDIGHKTFDLPSFLLSPPLSDSLAWLNMNNSIWSLSLSSDMVNILFETWQCWRCSMIILSLSCHSNFKNQLTGTKGTVTRTLSTNWLKTDLLLLLPNWPQSFLPKTNLSPTHNLLFLWISIFNVSTVKLLKLCAKPCKWKNVFR